jgi:ATP-binding cassette subfamily B protein
MLFYLNPLLAILVFVPLPIVILLIRTFLKRLMTRFRGLWQAWMYLYRIVDTTISGIRLVKAFGQETREIDRFEHMNLGLFEREWEANRAVSLYFPILTLVMTSGTFVIWLVGGLDVMSGKITMGSLLAFIAYAAMLYGPLQALGGIGERISRAMTSTQRVFEVLDTIPEIQDAEDAAAITTVMGEISYDHVTFGYDKHRPVLHDICLHVRPGEMIGLVGHSGAGKSTMMNLLCRFYDVDKGAVRIDGIDVKKIKNEDLHRAIGIVPQDTFLFEGSVAENISYAKPDAPAEAIIHAAVASNAHDFVIKLEDAYDSQVGERGHKFSRGQRQMISIARAILSDPSILVLDEPTSSVDLETEEKIQQALSRLTEGKTTFSIAHRLSTLRDCDRLFVLKEGRAVESGTHEELVSRKDSVYRGLADVYSKVSSAGHIPDEV